MDVDDLYMRFYEQRSSRILRSNGDANINSDGLFNFDNIKYDPNKWTLKFQGNCLLWLSHFYGDHPNGITYSRPPTVKQGDEFKFKTGYESLRLISPDSGGVISPSSSPSETNSPYSHSTEEELVVEKLELVHLSDDEEIHIRIEWKDDSFLERSGIEFYLHQYLTLKVDLVKTGADKELCHFGAICLPMINGAVECSCDKKMITLTGKLCNYRDFNEFMHEQHWFDTTQTFDHLMPVPKYQYFLDAKVTLGFSVEREIPIETRIPRLCNDSLKEMGKKTLSEGLYMDFNLKCQDKSFPCHKHVLAGHSEVMAAMLQTKMLEQQKQELVLEDMTPSGVEALLKFMYYGEIEDPTGNSLIALELLRIGDKYMISKLVAVCKEILSDLELSKIDAVCAFEMFDFGGMITEFKCLQKVAVQAFLKNSEKYAECSELPKLFGAKPEVTVRLCCSLSNLFSKC